MNRKYTYEEVKEYIESLSYELISEDYINNSTKLILKDKENYYYKISLNSLKRGVARGITPRKFDKSNPYTIQNIKLWIKLNNKPFELLSDTYEDAYKNLKWRCLKDNCREFFKSPWVSIQPGNGCPYCAGKQVGLSNCLVTTHLEIAKEWHPTKNGNLTPYDVTFGSHEDIWWQCSKNPKHEWQTKILYRSKGDNCPYCSHKRPSDDYNLLVINPELCKDWDYTKNKKRPEEYCPGSGVYVWWKCSEPNCGHEWYAQINSRNRGIGCPQCNESKGEKKIDEILTYNNWIKISQEDFNQSIDKNKHDKNYYIPQMKYDGLVGLGNRLLSYDFYLPKLNILIEYQGEQHERYVPWFHKSKKDFEKQLEHDKRKKEYAKNNNIKLLEIWYWDYGNIENILENFIINEVII